MCFVIGNQSSNNTRSTICNATGRTKLNIHVRLMLQKETWKLTENLQSKEPKWQFHIKLKSIFEIKSQNVTNVVFNPVILSFVLYHSSSSHIEIEL